LIVTDGELLVANVGSPEYSAVTSDCPAGIGTGIVTAPAIRVAVPIWFPFERRVTVPVGTPAPVTGLTLTVKLTVPAPAGVTKGVALRRVAVGLSGESIVGLASKAVAEFPPVTYTVLTIELTPSGADPTFTDTWRGG
jgi:hypothetical protein